MKLRTELHLSRKAFHVVGVAIIIFLYHILSREVGLMLLVSSIVLLVPLDYVRRRVPALNKVTLFMMKPVMRAEEEHGLSGFSYLLFGVTYVIYLFPEPIVTLSLLLFGLGDPVSGIVGTMYGKDKLIGNKSLQGTLAGFVICSVVSAIFFVHNGLMMERLILVSLISGVIGAVAELIPIWKLDDNFTLPVLCSTMLFGLFFLFGGF